MAEYIEREALIEQLKIHFDAFYNDFDGKLMYSDHICIGEDVDALIDFVNKQPTADVAEVKHGEWIPQVEYNFEKSEDDLAGYCCSECGLFYIEEHNFCPNCGALMEDEA